MKKEKWTLPADIEVEYMIPVGSSTLAECVRYCEEALARWARRRAALTTGPALAPFTDGLERCHRFDV